MPGWGGGVMNWEIGIDIYTLICIKWITNENLLYKKKKDEIVKFIKGVLDTINYLPNLASRNNAPQVEKPHFKGHSRPNQQS